MNGCYSDSEFWVLNSLSHYYDSSRTKKPDPSILPFGMLKALSEVEGLRVVSLSNDYLAFLRWFLKALDPGSKEQYFFHL